jgi:uncharacterized membrane protein SirB2
MSYQFYKILHFVGLAMSLTSLSIRMFAGGQGMKKATGIVHGVGLVIMLVGGFGMIARLGLHGFPGWIWAKLVLWLALGGTLALVTRKKSPPAIWAGLIAITAIGSYLALYKPF